MQSFRTRVNSILRRSSFSGKSDASGSDSDVPTRRSSGDKDGKKHRKRVSFGTPRGRSDTSDTFEQSRLAQQVVASTEANGKPYGDLTDTSKPVIATVPLDANTEYTKVDSPVAADESSKDSTDAPVEQQQQPPAEVVEEQQAVAPVEEVEIAQPTVTASVHPEVTAQEVKVEEVEAVAEPAPIEYAVADAWAGSYSAPTLPPITNELEAPFNVILHSSPGHSTVNVAEEAIPSFPEPAPYDTSFASTSSAPEPLAVPTMRVSQPLSAIDELRAKTHPLADWSQPKEDVNYDADEEETKPLLDSSILTQNGSQSMLGQSTLSLRTTPGDLKGKGRDMTPVYESLGWTEYTLPDRSRYFALHVASPSSPLHLKMPTPITSPPPSVTVVADYDLSDQAILKRVCEEMRMLIKLELPSTGPLFGEDESQWELWLHRPSGYEPSKYEKSNPPIVHTWVNHTRRTLAPRPYGAIDLPPKGDADETATLVNGTYEEGEYSRLIKELTYWSFIEKHPAHGMVSPDARREALEALTWSYADRLLQTSRPASPFSQEECQSLLRLIDGVNSLASQQDRMVSNRIIASIFTRTVKSKMTDLEASRAKDAAARSLDRKGQQSSVAFPFRRATFGFLSAIVCWGIPYLFLDNSSSGTDPLARFKPMEGQTYGGNGIQLYYSDGSSMAAVERRSNMMLYGAGVGVTAAVMIGSAVTVLTLRPSLATPARTAAFVALLCAVASLAASLISLARLSRASQNTAPYSYGYQATSQGHFFPGVKRDAESLVVLNVRASFSPSSTSPHSSDVTAVSPSLLGRLGVPFPWFY